ncbi:conserved oligomeric Golgi complex component, partial [Quaeritorhiza haematococci]
MDANNKSASFTVGNSGEEAASSSLLNRSVFELPEYETEDYLNYLTSCSLDGLRREPESLKQEEGRIQTELADLAYSEYKSFLHVNACSHSIQEAFDAMEDNADSLIGVLPGLEKSCNQFSENASGILADRQRISLILNQHSKILEILEIPQLIDTFIRNGYYEEAMDLQTHVQRLLLRHPNLKILKNIAAEVAVSTNMMLAQLNQLLRGNVKLPLCIRVIGYLRRMEAFPESELRLVFLQQRDAFFRKLLDDIKESDPLEYLKKYIELSREHFFDIITQYKAIFSDSQPIYLSLNELSTTFFDAPLPYATQSILSSYVTHTIENFINVLKDKVPKLPDATSITSILTQTMYYGMSLGRVGIDFRQNVAHIFEDAMGSLVKSLILSGVDQFVSVARDTGISEMYVKSSTSLSTNTASGSYNLPDLRSSTSSKFSSLQTISPPSELLSFPLLAHLLNTYFTSFNQLRLLPAISLIDSLGATIQESLTAVSLSLKELGDTMWERWSEQERGDFGEICGVFGRVLVPAVVGGFENGVYGSVMKQRGGSLSDGGGSRTDLVGNAVGGQAQKGASRTLKLIDTTAIVEPVSKWIFVETPKVPVGVLSPTALVGLGGDVASTGKEEKKVEVGDDAADVGGSVDAATGAAGAEASPSGTPDANGEVPASASEPAPAAATNTVSEGQKDVKDEPNVDSDVDGKVVT